MNDEQDVEFFLEEVVQYLNDPGVRTATAKAIEIHGLDVIREAFGDVRTQIGSRIETRDPIRNPPGYFLKTLKMLRQSNTQAAGTYPKDKSVFYDKLEEHLHTTIKTPLVADDIIKFDGAMMAPYSTQGIPWPTALGPEFFTLSTNKKKSDEVLTAIRLSSGKRFLVPMTRGKSFSNDQEWGILTAEDNRIIKAMVIMWAEDGCQHTRGKVEWCFVKFSVRRMARIMGYTNFGGRDQVRLARRLKRMATVSYYIDLAGVPGFEAFDKKIYTINFIDAPQFNETAVEGHREISVSIKFSEFLSQMFIGRKTVTRSKELVLQKNEIALLVQEYIESRVRENDSDQDGFRVALATLINRLHLPKAKWHGVRSRRIKNFKRAVEEVNGSTTWEGDAFFASIDENVGGPDALLRVKRTRIIDAPELPFEENTHTPKTRRYLVARERAVKAYVGKFERGMGTLAYALRQYAALRNATDPQ